MTRTRHPEGDGGTRVPLSLTAPLRAHHDTTRMTITMTEDNNAATNTAPLEVEDPMQNVMDEAQQLMDALGMDSGDLQEEQDVQLSESIVIDGFAIDSDEEDETLVTAKTHEQDDMNDGIVTEQSNGNQNEAESAAPALHPLMQEHVLVSPPTPPTSTPTATETTTTSTSTLSNSMEPSNNSASSFDFKAKTSMFASNLATFAQKAASQVADQITTTSSTTTGTTVLPSGSIPLNIPVDQSSLTIVEMDNEQKAKLIQTHVGDLLPGERVIMFLSNLLHVSDSSCGNLTTTKSGWCCCMTYYRMLLFHTSSTSSNNESEDVIPPEWNPHVWSLAQQPEVLQIPLASIDKVEKSVYTTPTNHTLMGLVIYG